MVQVPAGGEAALKSHLSDSVSAVYRQTRQSCKATHELHEVVVAHKHPLPCLEIIICESSLNLCAPFIYQPRNRNSLLMMRRRKEKKRVWQLIMKEAIQNIQMPALTPPPAVKGLFCPQRVMSDGPLKPAAVRSEMNAPAEHNGPDLNTTRIYARSEPVTKGALLRHHSAMLLFY